MQSAAGLADRLFLQPGDEQQRIVRLYLIAFGREPTADEQRADRKFLASLEKAPVAGAAGRKRVRDKWTTFCHVVLAANEFIYLR